MSNPYYSAPYRDRRQSRRSLVLISTAVIGGAAMCVVGGVLAATSSHTGSQPVILATTPATYPAPSAAPAPKKATKVLPAPSPTIGEGTWAVGSEVKPGVWTTLAIGPCYWSRLSEDGNTDAIIDNGNLDPGAHGRITIKKTDKGLELTGPCTWTKVG